MPTTRKSPSSIGRKHSIHVSREMRRAPTPAEDALWQKLCNRQLADMKFRRQHPIDRHIVDFYCADAQLVIEVDRSAHDGPNYDAERQDVLETLGLRVLRFRNADVLDHLEDVLSAINAAITDDPESPKVSPSG
jgi:very-short-patch-repair endonuclease